MKRFTKKLLVPGTALVVSALLLLVVFAPLAASAQEEAEVDAGASGLRSLVDALGQERCSAVSTLLKLRFNCLILNTIWVFDKFLVGTLLSFATAIFDWSISYNLTDITKSVFVQVGWGIVRDITNLFFIFIMLWIALATIFGIQGYGAKDLLAQVIIAALLINFSLAIGGFFINFTNALGRAFYAPIASRGSLSNQLLAFTKIHQAATQPFNATDKQAVCERYAQETRSSKGLPTELDASYRQLLETCLRTPGFAEERAADEATNPQVEAAIYQALWLLIIIPVLAFVFLAGAVFFLMRYLMLSILLIFAPIVFLFWILPTTRSHWNNWWSRLIKWSVFAPAFFFLLFLTITAFRQISLINVGSARVAATGATVETTVIAKEPPLPKTAAIGGLGAGLHPQEALAAPASAGATPKGFFGIGFDMILFVALMIMNLAVAQQMGIMFSGTVVKWGNRAAGLVGGAVRGAAYRGAIRGMEPAAKAVTGSRVGMFLAQTPGLRALTQPALAIQERREELDKQRAKQIERAAAASPDLALSRLKGESMAVKAAYAKSASPDNIRKLIEKMEATDQERFVSDLHANRLTYRIDEGELAKKVGEAMGKTPQGLTLRIVAKTGMLTSDPNFQQKVNDYLDELSDNELRDALTPAAISQSPYAREYITKNFKNEKRIGGAALGTPEKVKAFLKLVAETAEAAGTPRDAEFSEKIERTAQVMEETGNPDGARALRYTPMLRVLSGAGTQPFVVERKKRKSPEEEPPPPPAPPPAPAPAVPPTPPAGPRDTIVVPSGAGEISQEEFEAREKARREREDLARLERERTERRRQERTDMEREVMERVRRQQEEEERGRREQQQGRGG